MTRQARTSAVIMGLDTHIILEAVPVLLPDTPHRAKKASTGHQATLPGPWPRPEPQPHRSRSLNIEANTCYHARVYASRLVACRTSMSHVGFRSTTLSISGPVGSQVRRVPKSELGAER